MIKKLMTAVTICIISLGTTKAEYTYSSTLLDFGDTLGGVVQEVRLWWWMVMVMDEA